MTNYRNRILSLEEIDADDLEPHPGNWRTHPKAQIDALVGVLDEVGIAGALLGYRSARAKGKTVVIDGHLRRDLARQKWPVLLLDVDDAEADYLLATHDPLAAMAQADAAALDALLSAVNSGEAAVRAMLAELADEAGLYGETEATDTAPQIDRAEELRKQWGVEPGSLWALGAHKLICGDCTDAAVVARVMAGEKAGAVVTDPPYGQNQEGVPHDSPEEHAALMGACVATMPVDNGIVIAFQSPRMFPNWLRAIAEHGHIFQRALWLYKEAQETYPWRGWIMKSEMLLISEIGTGAWVEVKPYAHDCYKIAEVSFATEHVGAVQPHGSIKPLVVVQDLVSRVGGLVYDPFCGSGTTIIACENLGRKARAIEISPAYVAVALQRFQDHTGQVPVLMDTSYA